MKTLPALRIGAATSLLALVATVASAASPSGVQVSPDQKRRVVVKDVGSERWSIVYNLDDDTVSGNVFFRDDRDPLFVWCERTGDNGDPDPQTVEITFSCSGADRCDNGVCDPDDWQTIAESLTLPGSFFHPQAVSPCGDPISSAQAAAAGSTAAASGCP